MISSHTTAGFTRAFCPRRGLRELSPLSVLKCWDLNRGSKSKSVLCKAPTRDIWHRGSAVISIVVVVATRDQGRNANLLCQLGPENLNWVGTARWPGRLFHSGTAHGKKEDSIAVLVCRNVPEAVLTCRSSGCTSTVAYFRWILIY